MALSSVNNELQWTWKEAVLRHLVTISTFAWTDKRKHEHLSVACLWSKIEPRVSLLWAVLLFILPHCLLQGSVITGSSAGDSVG
jgi:glucose-6-phosphate isomerase